MANFNLFYMTVCVMLLPLAGALIAGLGGRLIGRSATHWITTSLTGIAFFLSCYLFVEMVWLNHPPLENTLYQWVNFDIGILLDRLSAVMLVIVTFVSFMVHIYTIGYMADDDGYQRFFSYIALFTFAMLTLVLANNFLFLFFGWEGVGLVSYLLIGFWFKRESAISGSLKAFLVNRVSDVGFVLAIAAIFMACHSLHYQNLFHQAPLLSSNNITLICLLLFIGAMGKSAQMPLHVWLPESMEGPTPISALIHAATMVTAGIYMVARLSPVFEYSPQALSVVLIIGATTSLFMGLLAVFQHDIKRVIAYSTLSQLGYMAAALGASAYDAAIFHLLTHAFFKALLFLAAGSVIIALHHEQDMRKMGGLAPYMPITYLTFLIGAFALAAIPPFSGFYSKDAIIEAVHLSLTPGASYAYFCLLAGAFITPVYIFRALFLTFHGTKRYPEPVSESRWVVLMPLIALAIPSLIIGGMLIGPMLFSAPRLLGSSIMVFPSHDPLLLLAKTYEGAQRMALDAARTWNFWLAMSGIVTAWLFNLARPQWADSLKKKFAWLYQIMLAKYGFDQLNEYVFVRGTRALGGFLYRYIDLKIIDDVFVNGSGKMINWLARTGRALQTGYLYHYMFIMIFGLMVLLGWFLLGL